jgi:hypothetical protein
LSSERLAGGITAPTDSTGGARELLEENKDYILDGLKQRAEDESDEEMPF